MEEGRFVKGMQEEAGIFFSDTSPRFTNATLDLLRKSSPALEMPG